LRSKSVAGQPLAALALALLALRLATSVLLLPPWAGFDEPYHHGYAEADAARLSWPGLREIDVPPRLVQSLRRWPLPKSYAPGFAARTYGERNRPDREPARNPNHETQQSPLYYWAAGLLLRAVGGGDPLRELYLLRAANAVLSFAVGFLLLRAAGGRLAFLPVALLALIPGFGIENCRVANDALCGLLISLAVLGALSESAAGKGATVGSLAAGLAPWSKLYGLTVVPWSALREARREPARLTARAARIGLILGLPAILLICSLQRFGTPLPVMYNVRGAPYVNVLAVPWLRDAWAMLKSHIWMSGMDFVVFPTWMYVPPVLLLGWGAGATLRSAGSSDRRRLAILGAMLGSFALALAYNSWRTFGYFRGGGGTTGWYLWAAAVPEILFVTDGAIREGVMTRWAITALSVFFALTVLADAALLLWSTGLLDVSAHAHILGVVRAPVGEVLARYAASRPLPVALAGAALALGSWAVAAVLLGAAIRLRASDARSMHPGARFAGS
jgi:hypothetical protein